jgi:hypothetical protein
VLPPSSRSVSVELARLCIFGAAETMPSPTDFQLKTAWSF